MKNLYLFSDFEELNSDERFLNKTLFISTKYKENNILSLFDACYNELKSYLFFLVEDRTCKQKNLPLDKEIKSILEKNCILIALQSFSYLYQKDAYSEIYATVKKYAGVKLFSNDTAIIKRILKKAKEPSYLNQFIPLKYDDSSINIGTFCQKLNMELFLNNQKSRKETLGNITVVNFDYYLQKLHHLTYSNQKTKLLPVLKKLFSYLVDVEANWGYTDDMLNDRCSTSYVERLIYYHNRELIFHSQAILNYILNPNFTAEHINSYYEDEFCYDYIMDLSCLASIPFTYKSNIIIDKKPEILSYSNAEINAAFTLLLKTFCISLFNHYDKDIKKCIDNIKGYMLHHCDISDRSALFPNSLSTIKTTIEAGIPFLYYTDPIGLMNLARGLLSLYDCFRPTFCFYSSYKFGNHTSVIHPNSKPFNCDIIDNPLIKTVNTCQSSAQKEIIAVNYYSYISKITFEQLMHRLQHNLHLKPTDC